MYRHTEDEAAVKSPGQLETGKTWSGLTNLDFCSNMQTVRSEFIDPSCPVSTVQVGGGDVMWERFSWRTKGPLIPVVHHLNARAQCC